MAEHLVEDESSFGPNFSHIQFLHWPYLDNVVQHYNFNLKLYLVEERIPPNFKFYETERQPMILVPLFNATERLKALEEYFNDMRMEYPYHSLSHDLPVFDFPESWIKEKTEVLRYEKGRLVEIKYNYV